MRKLRRSRRAKGHRRGGNPTSAVAGRRLLLTKFTRLHAWKSKYLRLHRWDRDHRPPTELMQGPTPTGRGLPHRSPEAEGRKSDRRRSSPTTCLHPQNLVKLNPRNFARTTSREDSLPKLRPKNFERRFSAKTSPEKLPKTLLQNLTGKLQQKILHSSAPQSWRKPKARDEADTAAECNLLEEVKTPPHKILHSGPSRGSA